MPRKKQSSPPDGFQYKTASITADEEQILVEDIQQLPLKEFEFHGFTGKRRVISFGWQYDFDTQSLKQTREMPPYLLPLREHAAAFAGLTSTDFPHALVTEYSPGSDIGWHRDRGVFDEVVGISLFSSCVFRFRRKTGSTWERYSLTAEPRSMYLLRGASRTEWEHSIPAVDTLRYSITFRSLRQKR